VQSPEFKPYYCQKKKVVRLKLSKSYSKCKDPKMTMYLNTEEMQGCLYVRIRARKGESSRNGGRAMAPDTILA
jgi:hypothetical protein